MQCKEFDYRARYEEYGIYREKETGIIYVGGIDGGGSRWEQTSLYSLADTLTVSWDDHGAAIDRIWASSAGGELTDADEQAMRAEEEAAEREFREYEAQLARFELIKDITPGAYGWQESLRYTVEETRQQLMTR